MDTNDHATCLLDVPVCVTEENIEEICEEQLPTDMPSESDIHQDEHDSTIADCLYSDFEEPIDDDPFYFFDQISHDDMDFSDTEPMENDFLDESIFISDNQPLYPGASVTVGAIMLLLSLFVTKHNLAGEGIQQLLNIFALCLPNGHSLCGTVHGFKKFFQKLKNPPVKHFYCGYCLGYIRDSSLDICPYPKCGKSLSVGKEYFLEMPVENQLKTLLSQEGFYSHLQTRFQSEHNSFYKDIYDGSLYKSYSQANGLLSNPDNISFTFNTDGASVFKSSKVSVWPLFMVINELPYKLRMLKENMILAGLWFGSKKPSVGTFLQPFLETFQRLAAGIHLLSPERGTFSLKAFLLCGTADLPARCLLCNCVQFNGAFSCWKCLQKGETAKVGKGHCHIFPYQDDGPKQPERTRDSVLLDSKKALDLQDSGQKNKSVNGIKGPAWLTFFPEFNIASGVAIDYMHGILLGVQKLMLNLWFSSTHKGKIYNFYAKVFEVDERLKSIKPTLNISRLPRSILNDLKYWKASEFRSFLLYYGAPVLNGILDKDRFIHYLLLVNSIFILLKCGSSEVEVALAETMLFQFVKQFPMLYDKCFMTLNMHQLVHLADSVRTLGPLYTHSCFSFEDKNGILLKMIRGTQNIDNQIITGVSFLQKLPELKMSAIPKDSHLEKLYWSIECPNILTRGLKIATDVFVLGAVKLKYLTDAEHACLCRCLGYDPAYDKYKYFKRLELHGFLVYGTTYARMVKRDNSTICYKIDGMETFGRVRFFILLNTVDDNYNSYAFVEELKCKQYSKSNILAVEKQDVLKLIPVELIQGSCIFVSFKTNDNNEVSYVCRFPNELESD